MGVAAVVVVVVVVAAVSADTVEVGRAVDVSPVVLLLIPCEVTGRTVVVVVVVCSATVVVG